MNDTINQVGAVAPANRLREALAGLLAIVDDSRGVSGYHLNGAIAEWDEFPEVEAARAALANLPECGCCGRTGECDADCDARLAAPAVQAVQYSSYSTSPGESVAGIALRQLGEESRWIEIRDLNAHAFPGVGPHDYYPAGTKLVMPKTAPPAHPDASVLVEALEQFADDSNWCYDTCDISRDVAKRSLAAYRAALAGKEGAQ